MEAGWAGVGVGDLDDVGIGVASKCMVEVDTASDAKESGEGP